VTSQVFIQREEDVRREPLTHEIVSPKVDIGTQPQSNPYRSFGDRPPGKDSQAAVKSLKNIYCTTIDLVFSMPNNLADGSFSSQETIMEPNSERVCGALLELLPSGSPLIEAVSKKLHVSTRTLQRRLNAEGGRFQAVLSKTREDLARHYLRSSQMSRAEISFLLGSEDPNSFFRAFHSWTGETPEQARAAMRAAR
jgi:AraC-like DNA-binding protein